VLEKLSLPAASAGTGAFLMAGYYNTLRKTSVSDEHVHGPSKTVHFITILSND
jgi:hypothetical protein